MNAWLALIAAAIGLVGIVVKFFIDNNPRIRLRELNERIVRLEDDQRDALAKRDMDRVGRNNLELVRLRYLQTALAGK